MPNAPAANTWCRGAAHSSSPATTREDDPAFLLRGGLPGNRNLYVLLLRTLSGRRVIVFDFLGWARSYKPQDHTYMCARREVDFDAVVHYYDLDSVSVVAHDAAGPTAVNWTLDHPEHAPGLTPINAFHAPVPRPPQPPD